MKSAATFLRGVAVVALAILGLAARAEGDPPGRVGRIADLQGSVSIYDHEQGQWQPAQRNRPLTQGDRVATDGGARGELRIGSSTLRLGGGSELEVLRLDDERVVVQLHSGKLALRIRSRDVASETEVVTAEARLRPQRSGHYRIDRIDDSTYASSWRGELRVMDDDSRDEAFVIDNGRRAELWRDGPRRELRHDWSAASDDDFGRWALREDQGDERTASNRYVSPEMTGAEDLDRNGRWEQHPEYGALWIPTVVQADWAPYRYGRWAWVAPWGWTWVDDAPWGFAPFHYGRWVSWGGRWCWSPGVYVARPIYAPALVAWVGGPRLSISVNIGGPAVGWVPLAPREVYVPWYRASPDYGRRVNHEPPGRSWPAPVPTGPIMYGNQGVPGAVTVVPKDVLLQRQPVARAVVDLRGPAQPVQAMQPPAPVMAAPVAPLPSGRPVWRSNPGTAVEVERPRPPREMPQPVSRMPMTPATPAMPAPAPVAAPPAVIDLRQQAPAPAPVPRPAPPPAAPQPAPVQVAPAPVHVPAPVQAPAPAPAPVQAVRPAPQPAPAAPPPAARPRPPESAREVVKEEGRPRNPESRANMREREQLR